MTNTRAVFVDRDGTLNRDVPYCRRPEDAVLLPTVAEGVKLLNEAGLLVVVVTNQSGIGRGYFTEVELTSVHAKLRTDLARTGASINRFYWCGHQPDTACQCRKPGIGMLKRAEVELGVDLTKSAVIGDRLLDIEMGKRVGALTVMVPSRQGRSELESYPHVLPDVLVGTFIEAVEAVLGRFG